MRHNCPMPATLTGASLKRRSNDVVFKWEIDGPLEGSPVGAHLTFDLIGGPNGPIHSFGFRIRDGRIGDVWRFDGVDNINQYYPQVSPQRLGTTWTTTFPADDEVARAGKWRAALGYEGSATEDTIEGTF